MKRADWTEVADLVAVLRRRWDSGRYLRAHASGADWEPIRLAVKGPTSADLIDRFEEVRRWTARFEAAAAGLEIEFRRVGGRLLGTNQVPSKIWIASFEGLCELLGTAPDLDAFDQLLADTTERIPVLVPWAAEHPLVLLEHRDCWSRVLATVEWVMAKETSGLYVRQIDVAGVDTKFVERHQGLLTDLLSQVLPPRRTQPAAADFAGRFGFLTKPGYVRFRLLDPSRSPLPFGVSEATLRRDELSRLRFEIGTVFVVENEVTYLAFPEVPNAVAIFGSGFASATLSDLPWMSEKEVVYWGDIDTHGYDILSRLRGSLPSVGSILMDEDTLIAHRRQWVTEPNPTACPLEHLTEQEQALYQDLITGRHGPRVRLEQERVRFSLVRSALVPWTLPVKAES